MMSRVWLILLSTLIFCTTAQSQNRTANWVFGDSLIVTFTESGPVLSEEKSAMRAYETAACISDTAGDLLLYSNGMDVWNRNHLKLFGSEDISTSWIETGSPLTGGALFIPASGDSTHTLYWLLTIDYFDRKLRLSEVDLTLDSGFGGIDDAKKNVILIDDKLGDQIMAIRHGNGLDWWIICRWGYPTSSSYCTFLLTHDGFISEYFNIWDFELYAGAQGEMAFNLDGTLMAFASGKKSSPAILSLHSFDRCDGSLGFIDTILFKEANKGLYGLAFSRFGEYIYCSTFSNGKDIIYQVSLDKSTLSAFEVMRFASPGTLAVGNTNGQFELGPDGKIYISRRLVAGLPGISSYAEYLGVIQYPDEYGAACQLDTFGFYLGGYVNNNTYSLPNFANYDLGPLVGSPCDTLSPPQDTTTTSINPVLPPQGEWSITPSISSGWYQINSTQEGWLLVHDLVGREVVRQWFSGTTPFDLNGLPAGMYVAAVMVDGALQGKVHKLLKQ